MGKHKSKSMENTIFQHQIYFMTEKHFKFIGGLTIIKDDINNTYNLEEEFSFSVKDEIIKSKKPK